MTFTAIKPAHFPWFDYSRYSFSLGLSTPTGAYLSGHTASQYDPALKRIVVRGGMTDQARTAYAKIGAILESAGLGYGNVVRLVEYVRPEGIERYAEAAAVRAEVIASGVRLVVASRHGDATGALGASVNAASGRAIMAWFPATELGLALGQVERRAVGLGQGGDEEDHEHREQRQPIPIQHSPVAVLRVDDRGQIERSRT